MREIFGLVLVMALLASAMPMVVTPAAAYEWKLPCDDGDNELTKDELVNAILPYMLGEGASTLDELGDAAYVYAYWDGKPKTVVDTEGTEVTIYRPIERIVLCSIEPVDTLRALKVPKETIVGMHYYYINPETSQSVLYQEFSEAAGIDPKDYESVLNLHPDAVVYASFYQIDPAATRDTYEAAGVSYLVLLGYDKPDTYMRIARAFGDIFGKEDEAEGYIEWRESFLNAIKERVEAEENRTRVCYGYYSRGSYTVFGANDIKYLAAGGENIFGDLTVSTKLDPEELVNRDPKVIIFYASGGGYGTDDISGLKEVRDAVTNDPLWQTVTAVKEGRVYPISMDIGCCPGSYRYFIAIPYFAKWFYPELFDELDPLAFHQEYLTGLLGVDYDLNERGTFVYHPDEHPDGR